MSGRQERRKVFEDRIEFAKIVAKTDRNVEEIIEKHFNAILVRFNIEKSEWADNVAEFCTSSQSNEEEWE